MDAKEGQGKQTDKRRGRADRRVTVDEMCTRMKGREEKSTATTPRKLARARSTLLLTTAQDKRVGGGREEKKAAIEREETAQTQQQLWATHIKSGPGRKRPN